MKIASTKTDRLELMVCTARYSRKVATSKAPKPGVDHAR